MIPIYQHIFFKIAIYQQEMQCILSGLQNKVCILRNEFHLFICICPFVIQKIFLRSSMTPNLSLSCYSVSMQSIVVKCNDIPCLKKLSTEFHENFNQKKTIS